jgi:undecaprenyl-diphosphatase
VIKHFCSRTRLPQVICVSLIIGGILLLCVDKKAPVPRETTAWRLPCRPPS